MDDKKFYHTICHRSELDVLWWKTIFFFHLKELS
jgi:hypothetical protein